MLDLHKWSCAELWASFELHRNWPIHRRTSTVGDGHVKAREGFEESVPKVWSLNLLFF